VIVAVTGGSGFIGKEIVRRHVEAGDDVRILSRTGGTHRGDLTDPAVDLRPFVDGADILYHCAGEIRDESRMRELHVAGTARLVAASRGCIGHWLQLSSVGAYGPKRSGTVTEDTPANPVGACEVTKTEADRIVSEAAADGAFTATILRPTNVIGPHMPNRSVAQLIGVIDRGRFVFIGPPGAVTNYVPVATVAAAAIFCAERRHAGTVIVNEGSTLESFVQWVSAALGRAAPNLRIPEPLARLIAATAGRVPRFPLTSSRVDALTNRSTYSAGLLHRLGFVAPVHLKEVVEAMVAKERRRS
jgi:nucleoside-diphosphate-sugar epimerase